MPAPELVVGDDPAMSTPSSGGGGSDAAESATQAHQIANRTQSTKGRAKPSDFEDLDIIGDDTALADESEGVSQQAQEEGDEEPGASDQQTDEESAEQKPDDGSNPYGEHRELFDAMYASIQKGEPVPMELIADMPVGVKYNGKPWTIPFKEGVANYQRQIAMTQAKQAQRAAEQRTNEIAMHWQNMQRNFTDARTLRQTIQAMGPQAAAAFEQAVYDHAEEVIAFRNMPPQRQQEILLARERAAAAQREEARIRQILAAHGINPQQQQQQQAQQFSNETMQVLTTEADRALGERGIKVDETPLGRQNWALFMEALQVVYDESGPLTADQIDQAAQTVRDRLDMFGEQRAQLRGGQPAGKPKGKPAAQQRSGAVGPRRMSGNAGRGVQSPMNGKRAKPSDFDDKFGDGSF